MVRRRKRRKKDSLFGDLFGRLARAVIAVAVLTAFVLAIAYGVKTLSSLNGKDLAGFAAPYLAKVGLEEKQIGEVAGSVFEMLGDLDIKGMSTSKEDFKEDQVDQEPAEGTNTKVGKLLPEGDVIATVAVIADSHIANDTQSYIDNKDYLRRTLAQASEAGVSKVIHVGDITNLGVLGDLKDAKTIFIDSGIDYSALPGDRDLWAKTSSENFIKVFGEANDTFKVGEQKFVLFDNSANYTLISEESMEWFRNEVQDADIVILSQPLFTDGLVLFNYLYMGSTDDAPAEGSLADLQSAVLVQRNELLTLVRSSEVKGVFAGDHHNSSSIVDPVRGNLEHHVVGATSGTVGVAAQDFLQTQRFLIVSLYGNGAYTVEDIILDIVL